MGSSAEKIWGEALALIKKDLNEQSFETWFKPTKGVDLSNNTLTIGVPYGFFQDWLKEHYLSLIEKTLEEVAKERLRIDFFIFPKKRSTEESQLLISPVNKQDEENAEGLNRGFFLNPKYTFESFVVAF
jgi:chromosomal replication initiator protein